VSPVALASEIVHGGVLRPKNSERRMRGGTAEKFAMSQEGATTNHTETAEEEGAPQTKQYLIHHSFSNRL
jgi:hypothetical protein